MATGWPMKTTYANGDVYSASDVNDITGTINLLGSSVAYTAGKNKIINGDFRISQRGTSFTNTTNGYTLDRWKLVTNGSPTTMTTTQQTFTPGTAPVSGYEGSNFYRNVITTVGTLGDCDLNQYIEDVRTFAGQTATISFWAKADAARTLTLYIGQNFGSGGSATVTVNPSGTTFSLTTSWQRFSATYSIPSISGKTIGTSSYLYPVFRQAVAAGSTLDLWGVQFEQGSTATAFQTATGSIQGELAACQRYYWRETGEAYGSYGNGIGVSSTQVNFIVPLPVTMRVAPTSVDFSALRLNDTANTPAVTNVTISADSNNSLALINATIASGGTQYRPYFIQNNNNTAGYLGFSAEL